MDLPLLHVDWVDPDWADWNEVLLRAGVEHAHRGGRRFGKFSVAVQAALADQGVAVGWDRLVRALVDDGRLIRFTDLAIPAPGAYYLTTNSSRQLSEAAVAFREWLREMAKQERKARTTQVRSVNSRDS